MSSNATAKNADTTKASADQTPTWWANWNRYWFGPTDPVTLHSLRLIVGSLAFLWLLQFAGWHREVFGLSGWFDLTGYQHLIASRMVPYSGWSLLFLLNAGWQQDLLYYSSLLLLLAFTLGLAVRLTAPLAWVVVMTYTASPAIQFDGDLILGVFTFYLMLGYLCHGWEQSGLTWWQRLLGGRGNFLLGPASTTELSGKELAPHPTPVTSSVGANLAWRLLQWHVSILIFSAGLQKLQIFEWWSGLVFWFSMFPAFSTEPAAVAPYFQNGTVTFIWLGLAAYWVIAWQLAFPFLAWQPRWRAWFILGGVLGWLGCWWLDGTPLFGPLFLIAALTFVPASQWRSWAKPVFAWYPTTWLPTSASNATHSNTEVTNQRSSGPSQPHPVFASPDR